MGIHIKILPINKSLVHICFYHIRKLKMYNIIMNNPEKQKSQEWLNNDKERNRRFGQLGLSNDQDYSELSTEEKQFLDMDYKDRDFIEDSLDSFIHNHDDISYKEGQSHRREYINKFMKWYNHLSGAFTSPDKKNSNRLTMAFVDSLFNLNVPPEKLEKINLLMLESDTPNFAKQMATFKILYPDIKTSFGNRFEQRQTAYNNGGEYVSSPVLNNIDQFGGIKDEDDHLYNAEEIIYRDILKCAFGSGGENVRHFLDKLSSGTFMMSAIMCWPNSEDKIKKYYSKEDLESLRTLIRQLHSMHYQTASGDKESYDKSLIGINNSHNEFREKSISEVKNDIQKIYDEYKPTKRYDLADRVVRSFCYPLGIKSLSEAYDRLNMSQAESYARHKSLILKGEVGRIHNGDLIKALGSSDYLSYLLESGILAKEYLGIGASSDCTPLDTDVAMVADGASGLKNAIRRSCAAAFSGMGNDDNSRYYAGYNAENVFLIFRNDKRFSVNSSGYDWRSGDNYLDYGDEGYYDSDYDPDSYFYDWDNDTYYDDYDDNALNKYKKQHRYYGDIVYEANKYEVFPPIGHFVVKKMGNEEKNDEAEFYEDDYGIRTGIPSSEIDYIATDKKSAQKVIDAVKESGLYIPVTDLDGNLIFNPFKS